MKAFGHVTCTRRGPAANFYRQIGRRAFDTKNQDQRDIPGDDKSKTKGR